MDKTHDPLRIAALRLALGQQPSEELPRLAAEALARGVDSPSLREAASTPDHEVRDARDRFLAALDELGIEVPTFGKATWPLVRLMAEQIVSGAVTPVEGASWIWRNAYHRIERGGYLRVFVGLASEWEDHPSYRAKYDERIVDESKILLQRTGLRR